MKKLLEYLVSQIAKEPEKIDISEEENDNFFTYRIMAPSSEIGFLIGKGGKVINSIRNIAKVLAVKDNIQVKILLEEKTA